MQEIEFRGKAIAGEWVYGYFSIDNENYIIKVYDLTLPYNAKIINPKTVGQFINRIDRKEIKIFAGDIVNISDDTAEYFPLKEDGGENFVVKWWNEMCGYWLWHIESKSWWSGGFNPFSYLADDEIEVIGNETENPELIGE